MIIWYRWASGEKALFFTLLIVMCYFLPGQLHYLENIVSFHLPTILNGLFVSLSMEREPIVLDLHISCVPSRSCTSWWNGYLCIVSLISMVLPLVQNFIQQQYECKWQNLWFFGKPCGAGYPIRFTGKMHYRVESKDDHRLHLRKRFILYFAIFATCSKSTNKQLFPSWRIFPRYHLHIFGNKSWSMILLRYIAKPTTMQVRLQWMNVRWHPPVCHQTITGLCV